MEKRDCLVDTCIFIAAFRGDEKSISLLNGLKGSIVVSAITVMELFVGARTSERKKELSKHINSLKICHLTPEISHRSISLVKKYSTTKRSVTIPDCIIAATAIELKIPLLTFNKKDFEFFKELELK